MPVRSCRPAISGSKTIFVGKAYSTPNGTGSFVLGIDTLLPGQKDTFSNVSRSLLSP